MAKTKDEGPEYWNLKVVAPSGRSYTFCGAGPSLERELAASLTAEGWRVVGKPEPEPTLL